MTEVPWNVAEEFPPSDLAAYRALVEKTLKGKPYAALETALDGGLVLQPLYASDGPSPLDIGQPGSPPYVRGTSPLGHVERGWTLRQEVDDPRMEVARAQLADDLTKGGNGVWLRVGVEQGVRVLTTTDLARVLEPVDLSTTSVCLEPESDVLPLAAGLVAVADARNIARSALAGCFGADPLGTLARTGRLPSGLDGALRDAAALATFAVRETPLVRTMLANSRAYSDGGASAVHELGYTIATGVTYLRRLVDAGLSVDDASRQIQFALSVSGPFFVDVAKLRAARWLWSKAVALAGGSAEGQAMALHARTASFTLSVRDPWVNMLRTTAEAFAAAVGGADSVAVSPYDAAVGTSDDFARRVARNQQLVLRDEAHLHRVVDPAGGSYFVESLTEQLARAAWDVVREVEAKGGMDRALAHGHVTRALEASNTARVAAILRRKQPIVGVTEFPNLDEAKLARDPIDWNRVEGEIGNDASKASPEQRQAALLEVARVAQTREPGALELVRAAVKAAAVGVDFYSLAAVQRMGRVAVYADPLPNYRASMAFEALRDTSDQLLAHRGRRPRAAVVVLGSLSEASARLMWTKNLLAVGGIETVELTADASTIGEAFRAADADFVVFAGTDDRYVEAVPSLAPAVRAAGAQRVLLAGKPGDREAAHREAGVDTFVFVGIDVHATLVTLLSHLGGAA